jgi:hypothetical protein
MKDELLSKNTELDLVRDRAEMIALAVRSEGTDYDRLEGAPFAQAYPTVIAFRVWSNPEYITDLVDAVLAAKGGFLR